MKINKEKEKVAVVRQNETNNKLETSRIQVRTNSSEWENKTAIIYQEGSQA